MLVRIAACRTDGVDLNKCKELFSPERWKIISQRPEEEQRRSAAGQLALKALLAEQFPNVTFPPRFRYGEQDKPEFAELNAYFNLSHSGMWAVCALCDAPVGIDIQEERPFRPALLRKFAPSEREWMETLPESERSIAFFDLWCLKEALCKCTGDGLRMPLNASAFTLSPVTLDKAGFTADTVPFPDSAYHLALCVKTCQPLEIKLDIL